MKGFAGMFGDKPYESDEERLEREAREAIERQRADRKRALAEELVSIEVRLKGAQDLLATLQAGPQNVDSLIELAKTKATVERLEGRIDAIRAAQKVELP